MAVDWRTEFAGRKVMITGACGTLGRWLASAFGRAGARLCLTDRDGAALRALADRLGLSPADHLFVPCDLTEDADIAGLVTQVRQSWGAPDVFLNNAGIYPSADLHDTTNDLWDRVFDLNLRAAFVLTRDLTRAMIDCGVRGSVVFVTSGGARVLRPGLIPYCVSKGALERLAKGFALELGRHGIRVNVVEPGFMPGPGVHADAIERSKRATPLGRHSEERDTPQAILYLTSSLAEFVTGAVLNVDGGFPLTPHAVDASANANNAGHAAALRAGA